MAGEARDTPTIGNPVPGGHWTADAAFWQAAEMILGGEPACCRGALVRALGRFGWRRGPGTPPICWSPEAPYGISINRTAFEALPRPEQVGLLHRVLCRWLEWAKAQR
ncbi:MAG: hypothetical protein HYY06_13975 [Deltaproteobacteria bacterium]|nr:hypothetical protein [Deltaproteobacteria bacterium]